jgi:hypothetical protein
LFVDSPSDGSWENTAHQHPKLTKRATQLPCVDHGVTDARIAADHLAAAPPPWPHPAGAMRPHYASGSSSSSGTTTAAGQVWLAERGHLEQRQWQGKSGSPTAEPLEEAEAEARMHATRWMRLERWSCMRQSTVMRPASPTPWRVQGNGAAPAFPSWFVTLAGLWMLARCVCQLPSDGESTNKNHYVPLQFVLSTSEDLLGSRVDPDLSLV